MSDADAALLVNKEVIITAPGFYRTRGGDRVEIILVSERQDFGCLGHYDDGVPERWHKSGRILASRETQNDIVNKERRHHGT